MYLLLNNNKYLHQIVESLYFCLKQNNIKCKIVFNIDDIYDHNIQNDIKVNVSNIKDNSDLLSKKQTYGNIYIIFNINSIDALPKNYIIYNFEQLITEREWKDSFFKKCENAIKVFDYSLENIKVFKKKCINVFHLPFGWCSVLESRLSLDNKDIDILFLGSLNKSRLSTISKINRINKYKLYIHNKCFGNDYDMVTSKTKIGLNIHFYEGNSILELTRIIPYICAGIHVISERSSDKYYDRIFYKIITFCKKEEMSKVVKDSINNYSLKNILKKKKRLKKRLNFENIILENINLFNDI
jgi:hypothetical protein